MQVAVTNNVVSHQDFTVTLKNDGSSNTTLGSANISPPGTFNFDTDPATAGTSQTGWTAIVVGNVLQLRSISSTYSLAPGQSMTAFVRVASPDLPVPQATPPATNCSAAWSASARQSNDYNGTNNWFTQLMAGSDMTPLGSFEIADIGTPIVATPFFTPAILLQKYTSSTIAYDSCHNVKANYSGAVLTHHGLTGATISPATSLNWSGGTGQVDITPSISETDNTITVTDSTGIRDTSNFFDTQQKICTAADLTDCTWSNGKGINASAPKPATGSLGVGFNPDITFTCNGVTGGNLGNTVITIRPHDTPTGPYQVTLVFSKQISGTGNANSYIFCEDTGSGNGFQQLPLCSTSGTGVDCVFDEKRITSGALQVILSLLPGDPYIGGK